MGRADAVKVQRREVLAWDTRLLSEVLGLFVRELFAFQPPDDVLV
jgi:hypothetical protein